EGITAVQAEDQVRVKAAFSVRTRGLARFTVTVESTVTAGGALEVRAGLAPTQDMDPASELARFGLTLRLAKELEQLCFYGLGGRENLPDLRAQAYYQVEKTTVDALHEPYIKPQDNGNRGEVRWLNVHDAAGKGLRITNAPQKFSFSAHHYTQASLAAAAHQEELRKEDVTFLSVDGFMRGTGTGSCGPDVLEQYCLDVTQPISFSFALVPLS
ncbi:MAG: hypothetical protein LBQ33_06350, partial [Oscillospiraceae bacterium]|nr:hypothetical protein [Oscillospiraceae bacterium]